jgi:DNA-binding response OmpR family regulator
MREKILVVDDEPDTAMLLELTLKREGYRVFKATRGIQALEIAAKERPDLIILDVMMPDLTGLQVLEHLHKLYKTPPVILFTAKSTEEDRAAGLEAGASRYLIKPTSREKLLETVHEVLAELKPNTP